MYHVTNRSEAHSLIQGAADVKTKISSSAFSNEEIKNIFSDDLPIYENIPVSDLKNLDNCIIICQEKNLTDKLFDILRIYKHIPQEIRDR